MESRVTSRSFIWRNSSDMNNIGTLYKFELKKILKNRLTIAMLIITLAVIIIEGLLPGLTTSREAGVAQKTLDGRVIDDELLNEMYPQLLGNGSEWNADNIKYMGVAGVEAGILSDDDAVLSDYGAAELYEIRDEAIVDFMHRDGLTEDEISWWQEQMAEQAPFTYVYNGGALTLAQGLAGVLMCIMLISALCLSTVFTLEHRQRTDQLILSCVNGRKETYLVKMLAGLTIVIGCSVATAVLLSAMVTGLYGMDGLNSDVQIEIPMSSYSLTMGQFIVRQMIVMITSSILFAAFSMAVSEILKNSLAVTGIMVGLFIFGQLEVIPPQYRLLSHLNTMLPSNQISIWSLSEYRLFNIGGHFFTGYVMSPVIYLAISVVLVIAGAVSYNRFQVTGR